MREGNIRGGQIKMASFFRFIDPLTNNVECIIKKKCEATNYVLDPFCSDLPLIMERVKDGIVVETILYHSTPKQLH